MIGNSLLELNIIKNIIFLLIVQTKTNLFINLKWKYERLEANCNYIYIYIYKQKSCVSGDILECFWVIYLKIKILTLYMLITSINEPKGLT